MRARARMAVKDELNGLVGVDRCLGKSARKVCYLGFRLRLSARDTLGFLLCRLIEYSYVNILPQIAQMVAEKM